MSNQEIHVGLDIGTTKVCAVVTAYDPVQDTIEVIGTGTAQCDGLKRGVVSNINKTAEAIKTAIDRAAQQSGYELARVVIGVSGEHISTSFTRGIVTTRTSEISSDDVQRLHHELHQVNVTPDRRILHVIPQDYIIDGQDGISDPLGMSGRRLEANALVITASSSAVENIYKWEIHKAVDSLLSSGRFGEFVINGIKYSGDSPIEVCTLLMILKQKRI